MKRIATGLCAALLLFSLVGCSDATTNVSDKNEALITIGTDKITKGDVYNGLVAQGDISPVVKALTTAVLPLEPATPLHPIPKKKPPSPNNV